MTTARDDDTNTAVLPNAEAIPAVGIRVDRRVRPPLRKMRQTSEDNYIGDDGYRMQREYGTTPSGNPIGGRWVLRRPNADWIDCDRFRSDLLERNGFEAA